MPFPVLRGLRQRPNCLPAVPPYPRQRPSLRARPAEDPEMTIEFTKPRLGRPAGTTYAWMDEPLYDQMDALIASRKVISLRAAAREVAPRAYGYGYAQEDSIVRRLVDGFRDN